MSSLPSPSDEGAPKASKREGPSGMTRGTIHSSTGGSCSSSSTPNPQDSGYSPDLSGNDSDESTLSGEGRSDLSSFRTLNNHGCASGASDHEVVDCRTISLSPFDSHHHRGSSGEEEHSSQLTAIELAAYKEGVTTFPEGDKLSPRLMGSDSQEEEEEDQKVDSGEGDEAGGEGGVWFFDTAPGLNRKQRKALAQEELRKEREAEMAPAEVAKLEGKRRQKELSKQKRRQKAYHKRITFVEELFHPDKLPNAPDIPFPTVREARLRFRRRKKITNKMPGLHCSQFHNVDASAIASLPPDYRPPPPPPTPSGLPLPVNSGYAVMSQTYELPLSRMGKRVVAIACEYVMCMEVDIEDRKRRNKLKRGKLPLKDASAALHGVQDKTKMKCWGRDRATFEAVPSVGRFTIVDYGGSIVYDKYIMPELRLLSLRSSHTKAKWKHFRNGTPFTEAKREIAEILDGCAVIGHDVVRTLTAIHVVVPVNQLRDTSLYPPLRVLAGQDAANVPALQTLVNKLLGWNIGGAEQCPVVKTRAMVELYKAVEMHWEQPTRDGDHH